MDLPPRPPRRPKPVAVPPPSGTSSPAAAPIARAEPAPPAELDRATRDLLSEAIARAVAESLGHVKISSVPPPPSSSTPPPPSGIRASMRAAAAVTARVTTKGGKLAVLASGALSLAGSAIVWFVRPEYAAPLAQAAKLIAQVIIAAAGGGAPTVEPP